ncbi:MAG: tRNA (adenosine(37)-N6)-threonylcarbamoyltransferase complex dimerization subunit type 1 TsaB, partial [Clostridia bacterium]|nr:tRNA (adenosine(37)-N6)-threonylcarbamoyltransferase complex dimerization subunit type 1 TsaB [Clostridia bacterium]
MKILAFECSATAASCAVLEDGVILGSVYSNVKLTHSQTLMPMMENLLASTKLSLDDIDSFAVANGPGSFTGIRIGISAVK